MRYIIFELYFPAKLSPHSCYHIGLVFIVSIFIFHYLSWVFKTSFNEEIFRRQDYVYVG